MTFEKKELLLTGLQKGYSFDAIAVTLGATFTQAENYYHSTKHTGIMVYREKKMIKNKRKRVTAVEEKNKKKTAKSKKKKENEAAAAAKKMGEPSFKDDCVIIEKICDDICTNGNHESKSMVIQTQIGAIQNTSEMLFLRPTSNKRGELTANGGTGKI